MFNLGQAMRSLAIGRELDPYTGVIIHCGQDDSGAEITFAAGNLTGYVLEINNPLGTQEMANAIIAALRNRGVRYRPYEADGAILDPAAEIGDNVTVNGTESVILSMVTKHSRLMASDISSPYDEEVDHEYTFVPRTQREFKRESAYARSRITQTEHQIQLEVARATAAEGTLSSRITLEADRITSEVSRATAAEGNLSTRITQTADSIAAEVTRATEAEGSLSSLISQNADAITAKVSKTGGTASSFAWELTDSSWSLIANGATVLSVDSTGLSVSGSGTFSGTITATAGTIGGVTIANGVLSGITDTNIAQYGISGGSGGSIAGSSISTYNTVSGINTNLGYGAAYGAATVEGTSSYPSWFRAGTVVAGTCRVTTLFFGTVKLKLLTKTIGGQEIHYMGY